MSKNITPADVVAQATEENLVTTVPAQGEGEKVKPADQTTAPADGETVEEVVEETKKSLKTRLSGLISKAKDNKQFFAGVVAGATATALVMTKMAKEKSSDVEAEIVFDEKLETEGTATDESAA